jgi:hypothetical protein
MLKSIACVAFIFSMISNVFADPKVGDACTTDQNCQVQSVTPTLKCNVTSHKCEAIPVTNNDNDH